MPKMGHPDLQAVIEVAESAVPIHVASGWRVIPDTEPEQVEEPVPTMSLEEAMAGPKKSAAKSTPKTEKE